MSGPTCLESLVSTPGIGTDVLGKWFRAKGVQVEGSIGNYVRERSAPPHSVIVTFTDS